MDGENANVSKSDGEGRIIAFRQTTCRDRAPTFKNAGRNIYNKSFPKWTAKPLSGSQGLGWEGENVMVVKNQSMDESEFDFHDSQFLTTII